VGATPRRRCAAFSAASLASTLRTGSLLAGAVWAAASSHTGQVRASFELWSSTTRLLEAHDKTPHIDVVPDASCRYRDLGIPNR